MGKQVVVVLVLTEGQAEHVRVAMSDYSEGYWPDLSVSEQLEVVDIQEQLEADEPAIVPLVVPFEHNTELEALLKLIEDLRGDGHPKDIKELQEVGPLTSALMILLDELQARVG